MLFSSDNGEELEFKVLGYQYPDDHDGDWDDNWLRTYIRVVSQTGSWQSVGPSLTTWELKRAIKWLKGIFDLRHEIEPELTFTEPNLSFRLSGIGLKSAKIQSSLISSLGLQAQQIIRINLSKFYYRILS
jgi:hypothetical protein